jgi:MSHA biogenesis protein MshM
LQIALFAQPELDERLAANDMRQLRERITQHFSLTPLKPPDVANYIEFRLRAAGYHGPNPFSEQAVETDCRNFRRPVPAHQHPRRQGAARRLLKRQPPSR